MVIRSGGVPQQPAAIFKSLPPGRILTLNFDAPEMWLVEPVVAQHDLDNLKLEQLGDEPTLSAEYELEALMLTGQCKDLEAKRRDLVRAPLVLLCWSVCVTWGCFCPEAPVMTPAGVDFCIVFFLGVSDVRRLCLIC